MQNARLTHSSTLGAPSKATIFAPPRHQIYQPLERRLHRIEVAVNIGVIELHVRQNQRVGKVVHELRTLVEEGRIVLVALQNEGLPLAKLKTGAEILRDAADQKRRPSAPGLFTAATS